MESHTIDFVPPLFTRNEPESASHDIKRSSTITRINEDEIFVEIIKKEVYDIIGGHLLLRVSDVLDEMPRDKQHTHNEHGEYELEEGTH
jgi:hypothetical protein